MNNRSKKASSNFLALIAITAWIALGIQLFILINNTPANGMNVPQAIGRFFLFFTVLTNLLVVVAASSMVLTPHSRWGAFFAKPSASAATTLYILVVGIVYNIILRPLWSPTGMQRLADELLHVVVPFLFTTWWVIFAKKQPLTYKEPVWWLIYPAIYLVYALVRGGIEGFYPYPFLDAGIYGYGAVALNAAAMLLLFVTGGFGLVFLGKKLK